MLKPQDIVLLLKLLAHPGHLDWPQHQLATHLCLNISAINASLTRLSQSKLIILGSKERYKPIIPACEELLIHGVKYFFPPQLGEYTAGIVTSYAAPIIANHIILGQDPLPVWPTAEGNLRGMALEPLYPNVPEAVLHYPDQNFYDLLALIDTLRHGRARERNIAIKLIKERLNNETHLAD